MKQHHMQLHPAHQISDNMALVLLPVNKESQDELLNEQELEKQKEFEHSVILKTFSF